MPRQGRRRALARGLALAGALLALTAHAQQRIDGGPFSSTPPPTTPSLPPTTPSPPPTTPGPPPTTPGLAPQPGISPPLPANPWGVPVTNNAPLVGPGAPTFFFVPIEPVPQPPPQCVDCFDEQQ